MKKITCLFSILLLITFISKSQTFNCSNFCILGITIDTVGPNTLNVTIYNGDSTFVNYPSVVVVNTAGDTVGNINNYFFFFGQPGMNTLVHNIPTTLDSLSPSFTGTVYYTDNSTNQTCSFSYPMSCTVGIKEMIAGNNMITVFPNPASSEINISISNFEHQAVIKIFNEYGQLVKSVATNYTTAKIDCNGLSNGIYFITVESENTITKSKFVIQN